MTKENLMANFTPPILETDVILDEAYNKFNTELQKMLDAVAPKKTIKQIDKPKKPMFQQIHQATMESSQKKRQNMEKVQARSPKAHI